jgi:hypothetical protein
MKSIFLAIILAAAWMPRTETVSSAWTTICENNVTKAKDVTFKIKNTGVANPFTDCRVQSWIGPAATDVAATGILTMVGNAADTEAVTLGTKVYVFQAVLTDVDGHVFVGANASASLDNLIAAIMRGAGAGVKYATSTTLHPTVTSVAGAGDTMDVTAKDAGGSGNAITSTELLGNGSFAAVTLAGGLDAWATVSVSWVAGGLLAPGVSSTRTMSGQSHEKIRVQVKSSSGTTSYCRSWGR